MDEVLETERVALCEARYAHLVDRAASRAGHVASSPFAREQYQSQWRTAHVGTFRIMYLANALNRHKNKRFHNFISAMLRF